MTSPSWVRTTSAPPEDRPSAKSCVKASRLQRCESGRSDAALDAGFAALPDDAPLEMGWTSYSSVSPRIW